MGDFIYFTEEQKERANAVPIMDILKREHEEVERSGNEWRWKRHGSVTFRGNRWYRHSQQMGSHAIDFMQEFFGMSYPEAVTYLLDGETGQVIHGGSPPRETTGKKSVRPKEEKTTEEKEPKVLIPPEKNDTMKRVYAYLMQKRHISREVLSFFARQGILYESAGHHNAVFVGVDKEGNARHIHKKGTCSDGRSFRMNEDGSDSSYGFGYAGSGNKLYVFEAPIDFLSFLTLYPKNWQKNSYIVLNGVSEHAMLQMLKDYSNLDTVVLCLDHDPAGIEACGRLAEILVQNGYRQIKNLKSSCKDWNEDLKLLHGEEVIPAQEHPKILECDAWMEILKQVTDSVDMKYATKESVCRYYQDIYNALKKGNGKEHLEDAFDGGGMLLTGVLIRCMEKTGRELGRETSADEILDNLHKRYRPHRDKGNYNTRLRNMQKAFEELMEVFDKEDLSLKENKEEFVKKCMIGAAGVGKTAHFLYPNIEYACACGMSFLTTDTKGDLYRNYAGIAKKYYGYHTAVIDLRNPTRSDGDNMLHLVNKYMDEYLADHNNLSAKAKAEKYAKITAKTIISSGGADSASYGQNAFFYDAAEGVLTAVILLIAEFCPKEKRHIISVFKLIQDLLAPSKVKGRNQFQLLMAKLPDTHKAKWFAGAALNTAEQSMQSVLSTALSRLNSFLDSELEQILCFDTAIDAEMFCKQKTAVFLVMPEEDNTKYFIISLILQQLYREILVVADENGGKLDNRVVFYWDEVGTIPKIESAEMMFSASRSRRVSIVPMIQSFAQLNKNYGKEGAEIIIDNCQDTIFGGFAPNSESAEVLSKSLGNKTVMSGSISRGKNDPSQSLQMIQRPLMTPDELKSLPKGNFIVSKTGSHPMRTKLKLFLKWGIIFEEPYEIEEKSARKVAYADKQEIEEEIIRRYMCCMDEEPESTEQGTASRSGGMLQSQMNETVTKVRQALRTED